MRSPQRNRGVIEWLILSIVAIFMCLLAVGYFTTQHPFGLPNYKDSLNLACGLTVYAPKKDGEVTFPYTIKGYANGCGWEPVNGYVGTAEILASNGLVLASVNLPVVNGTDGKPYYFEATIDVPVTFFGDDGMMVFRNLLPGFDAKDVEIPVRFN